MIANKILKSYIKTILKEYKKTTTNPKHAEAISRLFETKAVNTATVIKKIANDVYFNKLNDIVENIIASDKLTVKDLNKEILQGLDIKAILTSVNKLKLVSEAADSINDYEHVKLKKISKYIKKIENASYLQNSLWKALSFATGTAAVDLSTGWFGFASNEFLKEVILAINNTNVDTSVVNVISVFTMSCLYLVCRSYQKKHSVKAISKQLKNYTAREDSSKNEIENRRVSLENKILEYSKLELNKEYKDWCSEKSNLIRLLSKKKLSDTYDIRRNWSDNHRAKNYIINLGDPELFAMHLPSVKNKTKQKILIKTAEKTAEFDIGDSAGEALKKIVIENYYDNLNNAESAKIIDNLVATFNKKIS